MRQKIKVELDFEYLEKLSPEQYWKFVDKYLIIFRDLLIKAEVEYLNKRGKTRKGLSYKEKVNMDRAMNQRKVHKIMRDNLLQLNMRPCFKMLEK